MAGAPQRAVLDFGQVADAIMVGEGGRLSLYNMTLVNAAQRNVPYTDTHARYKITSFGPWPSLTVLPNATVRRLAPCCTPSRLLTMVSCSGLALRAHSVGPVGLDASPWPECACARRCTPFR